MPGELNPSPRLLLGPGPSEPHPRVLRAQAVNLLGHLDPEFLQIMVDTQQLLRQVFQTQNDFTFPVSGTGMAGMECVVTNLVEPGQAMVVCTAGYFGECIADVARRAGADVQLVQGEWGDTIPLDRIEPVLCQYRPKVLGIVHAETSTGAWQPLEGLGKLCHQYDTLLAVDAVTSLGTVPVEVDGWELDAVYSGSQKGLGCPPGMAPVTFSTRAVAAMKSRKRPVPSYYLDAVELMRYWGPERKYHHTAPISSVYALREGLRIVMEEGLERRWQRHLTNWRALKAGLTAMGLQYLTKEHCQLPALSAVRIPEGADDLAVRKRLATEFNLEIGGGLGPYKGKLWRIGLMGHGSRPANVFTLLAALERCLLDLGRPGEAGASLAAAERALI